MTPFLVCKDSPPIRWMVAICVVAFGTVSTSVGGKAASLSITIEEVRSSDGRVSVDLCPEDKFLGDECPFNASSDATEGETVILFEDVPPGVYGVQGFHDENANDKMDQNLVGWPLEGFAFANDPKILFRAPKFEASSIAVGEDNMETRMRMRYR